MKLYSTNNKKNIVDLKEAVLNAFPKDKGLYMPLHIKKLPESFFENIENYTFQQLSFEVAHHLIGDYIPKKALKDIIHKAIVFPAPVVKIKDNIYSLELFHGPTMAFKDFGARFMAELMSYFLKDNENKTTILVATSGDTGGAVASGFHNVKGIEVIILYPSGKVSPLQEKQLTTWGDNIRAIEIDGVFDDCQRLVKTAFLDEELNSKYQFSSANSINIARLIPQTFYYFEALKQLKKLGINSENIVFTVPSGNFGNLTAGLLAKRMGLPVYKFIAATNTNDTVVKYLSSGTYNAKASIATVSNAMDVGDPSNFSRIMALYGSTWNMIKEDIIGYSYNDKETIETINRIDKLENYTLDPHAAVAYLACEEYLKEKNAECVLLETAHPAKFLEVVNQAINEEIDIPIRLNLFLSKKKIALNCSNQFSDFKALLLNAL
ncbi:threonine synthase [bacterium]|nr:threonine synthase [bacterium]